METDIVALCRVILTVPTDHYRSQRGATGNSSFKCSQWFNIRVNHRSKKSTQGITTYKQALLKADTHQKPQEQKSAQKHPPKN